MQTTILAFLTLIITLLGTPSALADDIRFLKKGSESLSARLKIVREANSTISLMTYEFDPCDSSTKLLLEALVKKAAAGVTVQLVVDYLNLDKKIMPGLAAYLKSVGIQFYVYNNPYILIDANPRNHIKLLIVDNKNYVVGGRNTRDAYFGLSPNLNYRDHDLLISGKSGVAAQNEFNMVLKKGSLRKARAASDSKNFEKTCLAKSKRDKQVAAAFTNDAIVAALPRHSCSSITVVADNPTFLNGGSTNNHDRGAAPEEYMDELRLKKKKSTKQTLDFLAGVKTRFVAENQFYIPANKLNSAFKKLRNADEKKEIIVFTNRTGHANSDGEGGLTDAMTALMLKASQKDSTGNQVVVPISGLGSLNDNNSLTYKSARWRIHTKSAVRDSKDVLISSFNYDARSYHTNLESSVLIKNCPSLAKEVEKSILSLKKTYASDQKNCSACRKEVSGLNFGDFINGVLLGNFL